eukprot:12889470-Prorocentrum_lima.AAC.1
MENLPLHDYQVVREGRQPWHARCWGLPHPGEHAGDFLHVAGELRTTLLLDSLRGLMFYPRA